MDKVTDPSNADSGRHDTASDAPSASRTPLQQRIEAQRVQLLQAHGVLRCLYEVLLHAECDDAVLLSVLLRDLFNRMLTAAHSVAPSSFPVAVPTNDFLRRCDLVRPLADH